MRAATRIAFLLPLAAIALSSAACGPAKADQPATKPQSAKAPIVETADAPAKGSAPTTAAAPATRAGIKLRAIDWANATVPIPASTGCPTGPVKFKNHEAKVKDFRYWITMGKRKAAYGDLNGDGREEAVVPLNCGNGGDGTEHLIVIASAGNRLRAITSISAQHLVSFTSHTVKNSTLVATLKQSPIVPNPATQIRTYELRHGKLVQVSGPTKFEWGHEKLDVTTYPWQDSDLDLPFLGSTVKVNPNDQSCPRIRAQFKHGVAKHGGCTYSIVLDDRSYGDVNRDGVKDVILEISAGRTLRNSWLYAYTVRNNKPVLIGFVTGGFVPNPSPKATHDVENTGHKVAGGKVTVDQYTRVDGNKYAMLNRTFTWNGVRFVPNQPSPITRTDTRP